VIGVSDEMKAAFRAAQDRRAEELVAEGAPLGGHDILDRGLAAVLAIVERDYAIGPAMCDAPHPTEDLAYCEVPRGHKGKHSATVERAVDW
jgi:hypothetical protein